MSSQRQILAENVLQTRGTPARLISRGEPLAVPVNGCQRRARNRAAGLSGLRTTKAQRQPGQPHLGPVTHTGRKDRIQACLLGGSEHDRIVSQRNRLQLALHDVGSQRASRLVIRVGPGWKQRIASCIRLIAERLWLGDESSRILPASVDRGGGLVVDRLLVEQE